ncbi:phage recombination protein Bet [Streptomyces sp. NPDC057654]|uniref:phage recombination protein Bet n=1 Tax=Streptomyces sp. NPDC057654 TaxID=3346196 RepID=UPI0036CB6E14
MQETTEAVGDTPSPAATPPPLEAAPSAVVLRADQNEFDRKQVSALALITPGLEHAPRPQLAVFFHYCVRSGLDPFARQIYMIGRKNYGDDRDENPIKWTIQTGIDGFRTIAHRAAERTGERISYEDTVCYDGEGRAHEVWLAPGPPAAVKVTVLRGASRFPFIARWSEFAPAYWDPKSSQYVVAKMWRTMPAHMLRKCAEASALRMAAPQDLSGVYAEEEMAQADAEVVAGAADDAAQRLRTAAGLEADEPGDAAPRQEAKPSPKKPVKMPSEENVPTAEKSKSPRKRAPRKKPSPVAESSEPRSDAT